MANEIGGQCIEMWLPGYSNTDKPKTMWTKWYDPSDSAWYANMATEELVRIEANAAIDQIDMFNSSNYWYTDSMWTLYGVGTAS